MNRNNYPDDLKYKPKDFIDLAKATILLPIALVGLGFVAIKDKVCDTNRVAEILDASTKESKLPE